MKEITSAESAIHVRGKFGASNQIPGAMPQLFSVLQIVFSWELFADVRSGVGHEGQYPGAVFLLIAGVQLSIVRLALCEHAKEDFEQPLAQAAQRTGVAFAILAFLSVVGLAPGAGFAKAISPQVNGVTQKFIAGPAHFGSAQLAALKTDRRGSSKTLQH